MFRYYSKLLTLYKIGELHCRLLGTNGFHAKAENERFTAVGSRCSQNFKYRNFTTSFARLGQKFAAESVLHVQHDYFSSFSQSNHWFVVLSWSLPTSFLKLPIGRRRQRQLCSVEWKRASDKYSRQQNYDEWRAYFLCPMLSTSNTKIEVPVSLPSLL